MEIEMMDSIELADLEVGTNVKIFVKVDKFFRNAHRIKEMPNSISKKDKDIYASVMVQVGSDRKFFIANIKLIHSYQDEEVDVSVLEGKIRVNTAKYGIFKPQSENDISSYFISWPLNVHGFLYTMLSIEYCLSRELHGFGRENFLEKTISGIFAE